MSFPRFSTASPRSKMSGDRPDFARRSAAKRPAGPHPMTTTRGGGGDTSFWKGVGGGADCDGEIFSHRPGLCGNLTDGGTSISMTCAYCGLVRRFRASRDRRTMREEFIACGGIL